jgi:hypothetical protein
MSTKYKSRSRDEMVLKECVTEAAAAAILLAQWKTEKSI